MSRILLLQLTLGYLMTCCPDAPAHGGVAMEDDMCVIKIGFLKAHFDFQQAGGYIGTSLPSPISSAPSATISRPYSARCWPSASARGSSAASYSPSMG